MQVTTRMTLAPSGANAPLKAQKAAAGCTAHGLPNFDHLGGLIVSEDSQPSLLLQANYRLQARCGRDQERCKEDSSGNSTRGHCVSIQDFLDHCWRQVLKIDIYRPDQSDYIGMSPSQSIGEALENWPMRALDHPFRGAMGRRFSACPRTRHEQRQGVAYPTRNCGGGPSDPADRSYRAPGETQIRRPGSGGLLCHHSAWRAGAAGGAWLNGFRMTRLADRQKDRSSYRTFPEACGALYRDLPDWTGGAAE